MNYPVIRFRPDQEFWPQIEAMELHPTVRFYVHSLNWLDFLVDAAIAGETSWATSAGEFARDVAQQWWGLNTENPNWRDDEYVWGGHGVAIRAAFLTVLSELYPDEQWLHDALNEHALDLVEHFDGYWNHGLTQSLALMMAGGRLNSDELLEIGAERAVDCLDVMVDEEGAINEQAPEYGSYIERLIRETYKVLGIYGMPGRDALQDKKKLVRQFMAHAITPGGTYVEIGDSAPRRPTFMLEAPIEFVFSNGVLGEELPNVRVYKQGFVFGRSGFGQQRHQTEETYYTLRFGPKRQIHGHLDHLSTTYWAYGRNIIVDAGHVGYKRGPERSYTLSRGAHNVIVPLGVKHNSEASSTLVRQSSGENWQSYSLRDRGWVGVDWTRTACFTDCGPMVVVDRTNSMSSRMHLEQRWNIATEFNLVKASKDVVEFESSVDGLKLYVISYLVDDDDFRTYASAEVVKGQRDPLRGFVARGETLVPTWNVGFGVETSHLRLLTAIVPAPAEMAVNWNLTTAEGGKRRLEVNRGIEKFEFQYSSKTGDLVATAVARPPFRGEGGLRHVGVEEQRRLRMKEN